MGSHIERERKFDAADGGAALPDLHGLPGVGAVRAASAEELDAVYYDTQDHLLRSRRITLRRRTGGHDEGWHLKLPAGPDSRREIQLPLSGEGPDEPVPAELALRVRARAHGAALVPVARLHTLRRRSLLLDAADRPLAEIAEDAVTAHRLPPGPSGGKGGGGERRWSEVEAELSPGAPEERGTGLLDAIEERFAGVGLHRSSSASKLERALGGTRVAPPTAAPPAPAPASGSIGALLADRLREQVETVLVLDGAVRRDRPDSVHRMRAAVRGLRTTLRAFRPYLDRAAGTELDLELGRLGRVLGEARDSEVLGSRLGEQLAALPAVERPGPMAQRIGDWCTDRYRRAHRLALAELDSPRYFALVEALDRLAAAPGLTGRARRPVAPELRRVLAREQRRVARRIAAARTLPSGPERDEGLHVARKAAKGARYAGETAEPAAGKPARRFARRMKAVQTLLGDRQDALVARELIPIIATWAETAGEPGFGYGVLYAAEAAVLARTDAELPAVCAAALDPGLVRWGAAGS
ncbi:CYTH and CHAD domain-containing protein [Streptacidiphilus cavernicola]|uniref:CHAD domain-containing protein n=1 Tax=Streptacidiphilus cavernicola TaxID=3342716 RepID=A0ABV6VXJ3_9ACTN